MNKMERNVTAIFVGVVLITFAALAFASPTPPPEPEPGGQVQDQDQYQDQYQDQAQGQDQGQIATGGNATGGNASNEGIDISDNSRVENTNTSIVLVPNNNTESCIRVFGLAFGKDGAAGSIGWPWRSKACDFEQAGDDAFAGGEREIGWFWKCKSKNLYGEFRGKGVSVEEAKDACFDKMVEGITQAMIIENLRDRIEYINDERQIERRNCKEAANRLSKAWQENCGAK